MFTAESRYRNAVTTVLTRADGTQVAVVVPPLPTRPPLVGYHARHDGERLDLVAARHLSDPAGFWRLCDADNAMVPDALGARRLVGIPGEAS
jgi:hypothetical protein